MGGQTFSTIGSELGIKEVAYIDSGISNFMQPLSFACINMLTNQNYIIQACFHYGLMLWACEVTGGHPVEVTPCVSIFGTSSGKGYVVLVFPPLQDSCTTAVWDFQSPPLKQWGIPVLGQWGLKQQSPGGERSSVTLNNI